MVGPIYNVRGVLGTWIYTLELGKKLSAVFRNSSLSWWRTRLKVFEWWLATFLLLLHFRLKPAKFLLNSQFCHPPPPHPQKKEKIIKCQMNTDMHEILDCSVYSTVWGTSEASAILHKRKSFNQEIFFLWNSIFSKDLVISGVLLSKILKHKTSWS